MSVNDDRAREEHGQSLTEELGKLTDMVEKKLPETDEAIRALREEVTKSGEIDAERQAKIDELSKTVADLVKDSQEISTSLDYVKKEMDSPFMRGGKDLEENDIEAAIELQKRAHIHKGGTEDDFRPDMDNLVKAEHYRSAARKLVKHVGIENKDKVLRMLTEDERKAFDAASMDSGFFSPELLGLEIDCDVECASLLDLYDQITVNKTTFQYIKIDDYGALGEYGCDAACDGPVGPEGNISFGNGRVNDFRGTFCFQRNVLQEANYDLLGFMFRAIQRSHRINRNAELISGASGWLTGNCFPERETANGWLTAQEFRLFLAGIPKEYGSVTGVMHQNTYAQLISMQDADGDFIFDKGEMCAGLDPTENCIRISNCLPDPTEDLTLGSEENPYAAGSLIMAAAAWEEAYASVSKRPLWIEQYVGGSSAWCVMYQFGAEDGGFAKCCNAGRRLIAGAGA